MTLLAPTAAPAPPALTRADFEAAPRQLLRDGRWANAQVWRVRHGDRDWTVKDFARRGCLVRNTIGRVLLGRELKMVARLHGLAGTPWPAARVDAHAIALSFVPGVTLGKAEPARLTGAFFEALERLVQAVHARGVVHLDTRGTGNLVITPDDQPAVIDFQAGLDTRWMPAAWRGRLQALDLSGVYKHWLQRDAASAGQERAAAFERSTRWRRLWFLRGYMGATKKRAPSSSRPS